MEIQQKKVKLLIVISAPTPAVVLVGIAGACQRKDLSYSCFVTGAGVQSLREPDVVNALKGAARSVVCEYSWSRYFPDLTAPIEEGSQTDHSAMIGEANRVISL